MLVYNVQNSASQGVFSFSHCLVLRQMFVFLNHMTQLVQSITFEQVCPKKQLTNLTVSPDSILSYQNIGHLWACRNIHDKRYQIYMHRR